MALTGGLDTRVIMAGHHAARRSLPCYTFGSMFRDNEDVRVARRVADRCDQVYQVIETGSDFLSRFAHYAERSVYLTDGCVDVSRAPDLYVSEKAREIAPVQQLAARRIPSSSMECRKFWFSLIWRKDKKLWQSK